MAPTTRKSLVSRAGAAARKVVSKAGGSADEDGDGVASPRKPAAKKSPAKKSPATTSAVTKSPAKKSPAKKSPATKSAAKKSATTSPTKKAPVKKAPAEKAAPSKTTTSSTSATEKTSPAKKTSAAKKASPAKTTSAARTTASGSTTKSAPPPAAPSELVVLEVEDPWTKKELAEVRTQLINDVRRLAGELADVEGDLAGMIENSGEGAGNDQADVGSASFERDQEMVIVNNARDMLEQSEHALERIGDGSYGQCEICGNAIGKNRLMAFPRATMCLTCKQREERR